MDKVIINIRNGSLFPWHFQLVAVVMIVGSTAAFFSSVILASILLVIGVLILTGYSGVLVNKSEKTFKEYNSFLFIKSGTTKNYEGIEKIFINANKVSQKIYTAHTLNSNTFKNVIYDGYLKFDDGAKVHLMAKKDKDVLMNKLKEIADFMEVDIQDNTPID